jgi:hypothetical protein
MCSAALGDPDTQRGRQSFLRAAPRLADPDTAQGRDTPTGRAALAGWKIITIEQARDWRDLTSFAGRRTPGPTNLSRAEKHFAAALVIDWRGLTSLAGCRTPDRCGC